MSLSDCAKCWDTHCRCQGQGCDSAFAAEIERARVVGVLDAWAERNEEHPFITQRGESDEAERWCCWRENYVGETVQCYFYGPTPDAARAAAAKAIEAGEV